MADPATFRIVGRRIELDAELARALAVRGVASLQVDADQVCVRGHFVLPGASVRIRCRELSGALSNELPGGSAAPDAALNVSGLVPMPAWGNAPAPSGTVQAPNGQAGQDGTAGMAGGRIDIVCQKVLTPPRLLACGSVGGNGQSGGNGMTPGAPAAARNGVFNKAKDGGRFGGRVLKKFSVSYFISIAYGEPGRNGAKGGDGGAPGLPGRGGDGGSIAVNVGEPLSDIPFASVDPGEPGIGGTPGKGAIGGGGGLGGLHRLYRYAWFKATIEPLMNAKNAEVQEARKTYKLAERAASGKAGPAGHDAEAAAPATGGEAGLTSIEQLDTESLAKALGADFIERMTQWAREECEGCEGPDSTDPVKAQHIARWALPLAEAIGADASAAELRAMLATFSDESVKTSSS